MASSKPRPFCSVFLPSLVILELILDSVDKAKDVLARSGAETKAGEAARGIAGLSVIVSGEYSAEEVAASMAERTERTALYVGDVEGGGGQDGDT